MRRSPTSPSVRSDDEEIKRAKDAILNSFVFRFDSPEKVLQEKMAYEFYGYPLDFLENFQKEIEKVTKEDVARVAAKYIHRDQMAVLVVGNVEGIRQAFVVARDGDEAGYYDSGAAAGADAGAGGASVKILGATVNHLVLGTTLPLSPPLSWSFRIKDLADEARQVFELTGVSGKVSGDKELAHLFSFWSWFCV